jgi:hypothetical protein
MTSNAFDQWSGCKQQLSGKFFFHSYVKQWKFLRRKTIDKNMGVGERFSFCTHHWQPFGLPSGNLT